MSQQTFGHAAEMKPFALRQCARPDDKQVCMVGLYVFDDGIDDMAHLHGGGHTLAFLDEVVTHGIDQRGCSLYDRLCEIGELRCREVMSG